MDDKQIMANILTSVKSCCDLMMHGTIESATPKVHDVFKQTLDCKLKMQNDVYNKMAQMGWYPSQQADQTQIQQVKTKYSNVQSGTQNNAQ